MSNSQILSIDFLKILLVIVWPKRMNFREINFEDIFFFKCTDKLEKYQSFGSVML